MTRRAVVVMVDADRARWLGACATHVNEQGYELVAVADAATALTMVADGRADVVVAGTGSHLPAVEFAAGPVRPRRVAQEVPGAPSSPGIRNLRSESAPPSGRPAAPVSARQRRPERVAR